MKIPIRYFLLALFAVLAGCQDTQPPTLRVGINPWVGYDPLVLAREQALIDERQVKVIELMSNTDSIRALRNGLLDAAALTLDEALRLADEGLAIKIVAVLDTSLGADAVMARPDIASLADLKGKRIVLEKTALGALMLERALKAGGLSPEQVQTRHVEAAQQADMLANGGADAAITFEPMKSHLLARGFHSLFDSSQMPGEVSDVLVARANIEPARVAAILLAWERGRWMLRTHPDSAAAILAQGADLSPGQYLSSLKGLRFLSLKESAGLLDGPQPQLISQSETLVKTLLQQGLIKQTTDWKKLLDNRAAVLALEQKP